MCIYFIVWIYHFCGRYIIAIKVKDVVGQEYVYFSISKTETPGWLKFVY